MIKQIYALKSHMEQAFVNGKRVPVTCLNILEHSLLAQVATASEPTALIAVGKKAKPTTRKTLQGLYKKLNLDYSPRYLREVGMTESSEASDKPQDIDVATLLSEGKNVQVSAVTKGKGFTGVVKRWGFHTQPRTHGQSDRHRAPGSIARGTTPGRVLPGKKMAGHSGNKMKTLKTLQVLGFDPETRILRVSGPTPGAKNALTKITLLD